ncbi:MAG: glucosaminidase domain-containing protein [Longibaculum sp.]
MKIEKTIKVMLSVGMVMSLLTMFNIKNNVRAEDDDTKTFEMNGDSFYILDEKGVPHLINPSSSTIDKIQKENQSAKYKVVVSSENEKKVIGEYDNIEEASAEYGLEKKKSAYRSRDNVQKDVQLFYNDEIMTRSNSTYNIVKFKRTIEKNSDGKEYVANIKYTEVNTGRSGYLNPVSIADAAYIRTDGDYYICKMGGVVIKVKNSDVAGTPIYTEAMSNNNLSYYNISNGKLIHHYSYYYNENTIKMASTTVGYSEYLPKELKANVNYYSYDGHYFYESFTDMIDDYRSNTYQRAVNANSPYYNYYQYLSLRTKTKMTSIQFDNRVNKTSSDPKSSKMYGKGQAFIDTQNKYGINAGNMFGVAANESAYGNSSIAKNKNNIFGLNAVDSSPGESANYFKSVEQCINEFAFHWMSKGYLNSYDSRYRGPHLGDKNSGINVKYASDPYWGEKAASQGYYIDNDKIDYGRYTIGIGNKKTISLYNQPTKSSKMLYNSEAIGSGNAAYVYDYPVVILDTVTGNDGNKWYKIQSDVPLNADRSGRSIESEYDFNRDYAYVLANDINVVFSGNGDIEIPKIVRGDVNGNNKVDAADYLMVMDTILGKYQMQPNQKLAGDVNGNGKIDAADYLMIMDCILGKIKL